MVCDCCHCVSNRAQAKVRWSSYQEQATARANWRFPFTGNEGDGGAVIVMAILFAVIIGSILRGLGVPPGSEGMLLMLSFIGSAAYYVFFGSY